MMYLGNAFSINMVEVKDYAFLRMKKIKSSDVPKEVKSIIGHPDTAVVVSGLLGFQVPFNRESLTLAPGDILYVAQYRGPRLPEGATELPEGASIEFIEVTLDGGCKGCPGGSCENCVLTSWAHGE